MTLESITRFRGDTFPLTRTLLTDLTGATAVTMTITDERTGGNVLGILSGTITEATTGTVTFAVGTLDLPVANYFWDVQVTDTTGITTVEVGILTIDRDLTV